MCMYDVKLVFDKFIYLCCLHVLNHIGISYRIIKIVIVNGSKHSKIHLKYMNTLLFISMLYSIWL